MPGARKINLHVITNNKVQGYIKYEVEEHENQIVKNIMADLTMDIYSLGKKIVCPISYLLHALTQ